MNYKELFSDDYICLLVNYLMLELEKLPVVQLVNRKVRGVLTTTIREISEISGKPNHEYFIQAPNATELLKIYRLRESMVQRIGEYGKIYQLRHHRPVPKLDPGILNSLIFSQNTPYTMDFYNQLIPESGLARFGADEYPHTYKEIPMRTKLETTIASVLDDLDLSFKYEPLIKLSKYDKYPDFFIGIPFINSSFPIEAAGMLLDRNYYSKFQSDMANYIENGFLWGHNLLVIGETRFFPLDTDSYARQISDIANIQVADALSSSRLSI